MDLTNGTVESTKIKGVMLKKGVLSKRDFTRIGIIDGDYSCNLIISLIKFTTLKGKDTMVQFGAKLEIHDNDDTEYSALMDLDEIPEFINAIEMIKESTSHIKQENYNYSEMDYTTKDNVKIGIYKDQNGKIKYFMGVNSQTLFFNFDGLEQIDFNLKRLMDNYEIKETKENT